MEDFYKGYLLDYLEFIYGCGKNGQKVYFSSQKNVPVGRGRLYPIVMRNGVVEHYATWTHFIETLYAYGQEGRNVNVDRMKVVFRKDFPELLDKQIVVEYLTKEEEEEILYTYADFALKSKELRAADFKEWIVTALHEMGIEYELNWDLGVKKQLQEVKNIFDERGLL